MVVTMQIETREGERIETIDELSDLLCIAQGMGSRLANESHGESYSHVTELNELMHRACLQLDKIKAGAVEAG